MPSMKRYRAALRKACPERRFKKVEMTEEIYRQALIEAGWCPDRLVPNNAIEEYDRVKATARKGHNLSKHKMTLAAEKEKEEAKRKEAALPDPGELPDLITHEAAIAVSPYYNQLSEPEQQDLLGNLKGEHPVNPVFAVTPVYQAAQEQLLAYFTRQADMEAALAYVRTVRLSALAVKGGAVLTGHVMTCLKDAHKRANTRKDGKGTIQPPKTNKPSGSMLDRASATLDQQHKEGEKS